MIGETYYYRTNGLAIEVIVKDIKQAYGRIRYLIAPVSGQGEVWVEELFNIDEEIRK